MNVGRCCTLFLAQLALFRSVALSKVMVSAPDLLLAVDHFLMRIIRTRRCLPPLFFHSLTTLIRPILLVLGLGAIRLLPSIAGPGGPTRSRLRRGLEASLHL